MQKTAIVAALAVLAGISMNVHARGGGGHGGHSSSHSGYSSHSSHSASGVGADHTVHGYTRKDGAYVAPHHATNPNSTRNDNYSTQGNVNPYTGQAGTRPRDGER
jgi:hypothetical protein